MKTWRQLEAMANRQGLTLLHGDHSWRVNSESEVDVGNGEWWARPRSKTNRVLRAMVEGVLTALRSKP